MVTFPEKVLFPPTVTPLSNEAVSWTNMGMLNPTASFSGRGEEVEAPRTVFSGEDDGEEEARAERRLKGKNELRDWLNANDIGCEIYYPVPLHLQECLGELAGRYSCPEAEKAAEETIALPVYPELTEEMQEYVVKNFVQFYS